MVRPITPDSRGGPPEQPLDGVEGLVGRWLDTPEPDRARALDELARSHPESAAELRRRVALLESLLDQLPAAAGEIPERLGPFRLKERLGGGGMGVVYAAEDEVLGREVALKVVRPDLVFFERARERFRREVEAVARLQHPGIVPVYSVGEERGVPYFAMERVDGCTLAEVIDALAERAPESLAGADIARALARSRSADEEKAALALPEAWRDGWVQACLDLARQIAAALHHAHSRGILHRDVKPSNIALTPDGRARLIDFGLSVSAENDALTRTGTPIGTLLYMAPEQVRGARELDARADVYGLGATLYELLALQPPFRGGDAVEVGRRVAEGGPDPLRARNRAVPVDVETVVGKALDVEPQRRYRDAAAFERDLANLLAHRPVEARTLGALLRLRRFAQRRPALATGAALGALLAVGVPSALLLQERAHAARLEESLEREQASLARAEGVTNILLDSFDRVTPERNGGVPPTLSTFLDDVAKRVAQELDGAAREYELLALGVARAYTRQAEPERALSVLAELVPRLRADAEPEAAPLLVLSLRYQARARLALGDLADAEANLGEAMQLAAALVAAGAVAEGLQEQAFFDDLARLRGRQGRADEAVDLMRRSLAWLEELGADACRTARERVRLGTSLIEANADEEALAVLAQCSEALRGCGGDSRPMRIEALNGLGLVARRSLELDRAETAYREALAEAELLYGSDRPAYQQLRANLAGVREARGDFAGAAEDYLSLADWFAAQHGPESGDAVVCRGNAAGSSYRAGQMERAAELYDEVLPLQRARFGDAHPFVAFSLSNRGGARTRLGEPLAGAADLHAAGAVFAQLEGRAGSAFGAFLAAARGFADHGEPGRAASSAREALAVAAEHGLASPELPFLRALAGSD